MNTCWVKQSKTIQNAKCNRKQDKSTAVQYWLITDKIWNAKQCGITSLYEESYTHSAWGNCSMTQWGIPLRSTAVKLSFNRGPVPVGGGTATEANEDRPLWGTADTPGSRSSVSSHKLTVAALLLFTPVHWLRHSEDYKRTDRYELQRPSLLYI